MRLLLAFAQANKKERKTEFSGEEGADSSCFEWQLEKERDYYLPAFAPLPPPRPFLPDENGQTSLEITSSRASKCSPLLRGAPLLVKRGWKKEGGKPMRVLSSLLFPSNRICYFQGFRHQFALFFFLELLSFDDESDRS